MSVRGLSHWSHSQLELAGPIQPCRQLSELQPPFSALHGLSLFTCGRFHWDHDSYTVQGRVQCLLRTVARHQQMFRDEPKDRASMRGHIPTVLPWPLTNCSSLASWARTGVLVFIHIFLLWVCLTIFWTHNNFHHPQCPKARSPTASLCSVGKKNVFWLVWKMSASPVLW